MLEFNNISSFVESKEPICCYIRYKTLNWFQILSIILIILYSSIFLTNLSTITFFPNQIICVKAAQFQLKLREEIKNNWNVYKKNTNFKWKVGAFCCVLNLNHVGMARERKQIIVHTERELFHEKWFFPISNMPQLSDH